MDTWLEELEVHGVSVDVPRVLVGNKCDQDEAKVKTEDAQRWADDRGMPLFETSAKDDSVADHFEGIFLTLAHKLREGRTMIEPLSDPSNPDNRPVRVLYTSSLAAPPEDEP